MLLIWRLKLGNTQTAAAYEQQKLFSDASKEIQESEIEYK